MTPTKKILSKTGEPLLSARAAAKRLSCAPDYIGKLCREGKLVGIRQNNAWFVEPDSITAFEESRVAAKLERAKELSEIRKQESKQYREQSQETKSLLGASLIEVAAKVQKSSVSGARFHAHHFAVAVVASLFFGSLVFGGSALMERSGFAGGGPLTASLSQLQSPFFGTGAQISFGGVDTTLGSFISGIFGGRGRTLADAPVPDTLPAPIPVEPTATSTQLQSSFDTGSTTSSGPTTIIQNVYPIRDHIVERVVTQAGVTEELMNSSLEQLGNQLRSEFYTSLNGSNGLPSGGGIVNNVALSQRIDKLNGVTITNSTVNGLSGLTDADIPDNITVSNYLQLSGYNPGDILYADATGTLKTLPIGANGRVLKIAGGVPVWGVETGGGGGGGAWATTTDALAVYPSDPSQVVIIGDSATSTTGNIFEVSGNSLFRNAVTAYGVITGPRFVATSTVASILPFASSTALSVSGTGYFGTVSTNNLSLGNGNGPLQVNNGVVSATSSVGVLYGGTGTSTAPSYGQLLVGNALGGYDLLSTSSLGIVSGSSSGFSTTSANYWSSLGLGFSTTSANYWSSVNNFSGFSTTSADYWLSSKNATTTSLAVTGAATSTFAGGLAINGGGLKVSTLTSASCDVKADSNGNLYCGIDATSAGAQDPFVFASNYGGVVAATSSSLWLQNGIFASSTSHFAAADFTSATSSAFAVLGSTTISNVLNVGGIINANGGLTLPALASALLSTNGSGVTQVTTVSAPLNLSGSTLSISQAGTGSNGYLSSTDWNFFNNKISSTSLSGGSGISYNSSTGVIANTIAYPFPGNATSTQIAFNGGLTAAGATTTSLAVSASSTINTLNLTNALGVAFGGTGKSSAPSYGQLLVGNALGGYDLLSTSSLGIVSGSSSGFSTTSADYWLGSKNATTTSLALTGTATSTFAGGLIISGGGLQVSTLTSASCDVKADSNGNLYCGIDATGSAGGAFAFTPASNYGLLTNATSTPLWFQQGFQASSTSQIAYASTTAVSATIAYLGTASTSNLTVSNLPATLLSTNASGITQSTTVASPLAFSGSSLTLTQATLAADGYLAAGDFATFNNKISSTSLSGLAPITYNSSTGAIGFDTSVANSFTGLQNFRNSSSTLFSVNGKAYFGGSATTTIDSTGSLAVGGNFTGAGLTTCGSAADKLLWTGGQFSCGADNAGSATLELNWNYFNGSGLRLGTTSNQVIIGATATSSGVVPLAAFNVLGGAGFDNATSTNFFATTASSTNLTVGNNQVIYGNLGLGSTSPSARLSIFGGNIIQQATGTPVIATSTTTTGNTYASAVQGRYVYIADNLNGLTIYDNSNPKRMTLVGTYSGITGAVSVVVSGRYAYVGDTTAGVVIVDVSNPSNPVAVGSYASGDAYGIALSGKYVYAGNYSGGNIKIIDVSDPTNPTLAATYNSGGAPYGLVAQGRYLYVANQGPQKFQVIDVSNPTAPSAVGSLASGFGFPTGIYVSGKYAYIADASKGLQIVNIGNPKSPSIAGSYETTGSFYGVAVAGNYAYVADHSGGKVKVIDVSSPSSPKGAGILTLPAGSPLGITVSGKYAYVADDDQGLSVLDINGIDSPAAHIGSIEASTVNVADNLSVGNNIYAGGGLDVGISGIFSRGAISAFIASTTQINPVVANFMGGNVGIGTSTPYATLSVSGRGVFDRDVRADYFTATSTSQASTFAFASTTAITVSGTASTSVLFANNATTTTFAITGTTSSLLKTLANGAVVAAIPGTDYIVNAAPFPFFATTFGSTNANATSTLIGFTNGFYSLASSTIGNGTQAGGLTISGGATTTGNLYIGGSAAATNLAVTASTTISGQFNAVGGATLGSLAAAATNLASLTVTGATSLQGATSTSLAVTGSTTISSNLNAVGTITGGTLNLTNALTVSNGGTGSTTLTGLLVGNGTGSLQTATINGPLSFSGNTLSISQSGLATDGYLSSTDWNLFNNKISSSSIDTSAELAALLTDETGSGFLVFSASPTFTGTAAFANLTAVGATTSALSVTASSTIAGQFNAVGGATLGALTAAATNLGSLTVSGNTSLANATTTGSLAVTASTTIAGQLNAVGGATLGALTLGALPGTILSTNGSGVTQATTVSAPLSFSGSTLSITQSGLAQNGYLSSTDFNTFNNKISSTSLSAGPGISYNSSTGVITNTIAFPFTSTTNYGALANSTSTPIWFTQGIQASSTSQFANANFVNATTTSFAALGSTTISGQFNAVGGATLGALTAAATNLGSLTVSGNTSLANATTTGSFAVAASSTVAGQFNALGGATLGTLTLTGALIYGGVTANNAVTGTGNLVLSASPTFTGTAAFANLTAIGATTSALAVTGSTTISSNLNAVGTITGGTLNLTNALTVPNGGTGSTTLGGILTGNGTGVITSAAISAPLSFSGNTLSISQSGLAQNGYLSSTDFNTFNNKISSTSLSGGNGISYNSSTGVITNTIAFPFTSTTNYGALANSTSTPIWFTQGIQASSTSHFAAVDVSGTTGGYQIDGNIILQASSTTGTVSIGQGAGARNNASATYNTLLGYQAGNNITNGANNILIGAVATAVNDNLTTGSGNIKLGYNISLPSSSANNQLNIGNLLYGTNLDGSAQTYSTGQLGVGSTSPYARFAIQANNGDANKVLFAIGSSTATATTTLFSVSNTGNVFAAGSTTIAGQLNAVGGATLGNTSLANATTTGSLAVTASTTIAGQLNAVGGATLGTLAAAATNLASLTVTGATSLQGATSTSLAVTGSTTVSSVLNIGGTLNANGGITLPTLTSTLLSTNGSGVTQATTVSAPLSFSGSTLSITQSGLAQNGYLSSTDFNTFNNKISSTSLSAGAGINYNSSTGVITNTIAYPFGLTGNATSTLTQFNGGLTAYASSTIGDGTQAGGLTISGGATTTGISSAPTFNATGATTNVLTFSGNSLLIASSTLNTLAIGFGSSLAPSLAASNSVFIGNGAGSLATNASNSVFFGTSAGSGASGSFSSNFFGNGAGYNASAAQYSNFYGYDAGNSATNANSSNFFGLTSGKQATNANNSNFFGNSAGLQATNASNSNFFGPSAGYLAVNASHSSFIGDSAGASATNAANSLFIGSHSGENDTVDNTGGSFSVAIGNYSGTGGFANSIALGNGVINSAANQLNVGNVLFASGLYSSNVRSSAPQAAGRLGVATSSPYARLSIQANNGDTNTTLFAIGSSTASATTTLFSVSNTGLVTGGNYSLTNGTTTGSLAVTASTTIAGQLNAVGGATLGALTLGALPGTILSTNGSGVTQATTVSAPLSFSGSTLSITQSGLAQNGYLSSTDFNTFNNKISSTSLSGGNGISYNSSTGVITNTIAYPFGLTGNATSTLTQFNGGLTAYASSTIGDGTQAGGLTVSGGATTTGNAYFASRLGIGDTSPDFTLDSNGTQGFGYFGLSTSNAAEGDILKVDPLGNLGLGTSTPYANLSVQNNYGSANTTVFAISSSTATNGSTSSTLFKIDNQGNVSAAGSFAINAFSANSITLSATGRNMLLGTDGSGNVVSTSTPSAAAFLATSTTAINIFPLLTATTATTTNLTVTGASNGLLKTNSLGQVSTAVPNVDYAAFAFPWNVSTAFGSPANATSTLIGFTGGLYSLASSTIGNGNQNGGLTISGGATTTGNAYFTGNVGIGTFTPSQKLQVVGNIIANNIANVNCQAGYTVTGFDGSGNIVCAVVPTASTTASNIKSFGFGHGASYGSAYFVTADGQVFGAGYNGNYELGQGDTTNRGFATAIPLPAGKYASSTVAFNNGAYAIHTDGTVSAWGYNNTGQLGLGDVTVRTNPQLIPTLSNVKKIVDTSYGSTGSVNTTTCALTTSGALYCWGYNAYGQVGDYTTTQRTTPVQVATTSGTIADVVATGEQYGDVCAINTSGQLFCWGYNGYGQVGNYTTTNQLFPLQVATTSGTIASVNLGGTGSTQYTCAVNTTGSLYCWGYNAQGNLGDYSTTQRNFPVNVATTSGTIVKTFNGGGSTYVTNCALNSLGKLFCAGYSGYGQLGDYTTTARNNFIAVATSTGTIVQWEEVGTGSYGTSCVLNSIGQVYCWGYNATGGAANGGTASPILGVMPNPVGGLNNIVELASTGYTNTGTFCARSGGGQVKCWGYNDYGEVGAGNTAAFVYSEPTTLLFSGNTSNLGYWDKNNANLFYLQGNVGVGTTTASAKLTITGTGTGQGAGFLVTDVNQKTNFTVLDNGNVGVGTTTPYAKLSIAGQTVAQYFTATSTTNISTFPLLSSTNATITTATFTNATSTTFFSTVASSTNLYTSNFSLGSLSGMLRATAGVVSAGLASLTSDVSGILPTANGGTGVSSATYGQILVGNGTGFTLTATSSLGINLANVTGSLSVAQGGTGVTSYTAGDILYASGPTTLAKLAIGFPGQVLKITGGNLPAWGPDQTSSGGTTGSSPWATTTNSLATYPVNTANVVIIGAGATTTLTNIMETYGNSYFSGNVGIGTTTAGSLLSVGGVANFSISTSTFYSTGGINLTGGCFAVNGVCISGGSGAGTTGQVPYFSSTNTTAGTSSLFIAATGYVGVGTTSPWAKFSIDSSNLGATAAFAIGSSTATQFIVNNGGQVGIGTSTPYAQLGVTKTASTPQLTLGYDSSTYTDFRTDATGNLWVLPAGSAGGGVYLPSDNLYVCSGGSLTSNACPTGTPSGTGNLVVANKLAVGTSTPNFNLTVAGTRPSIDITDTSAGTNLKHWLISSQGGNLYIGTSTDAYATTSIAALTLTNNGRVGIGTTTPSKQFSISDLLYVGASGTSSLGVATSTFQGDIKIIGKLDVSTIDPVYTIDGIKYATYGHSTIGIHEETVQTLALTQKDATGKYSYHISFDTLGKGSDLWLFYQVTNFGADWKDLVVNLTPSFDGAVYYEKDPATNELIVRSDTPGEVSMRLIATRYDSSKWPNLRTDQGDKNYLGHQLELKPVGGGDAVPVGVQTTARIEDTP